MLMRTLGCLTALLLLLVGCGDDGAPIMPDGGTTSDAGADAANGDAGTNDDAGGSTDAGEDAGAGEDASLPDLAVDEPVIDWLADGQPTVAPPVLTPCADGWVERELGGVVTCEPWDSGEDIACPDGQVRHLGRPSCEPVGTPCPTGDYAEGLPDDGTPIVYVLVGASGGDGTLGDPFGTLAEVASAAPAAGTIVALSRGTHEGGVDLPSGLTLFGACVAETELVPQVDGAAVMSVVDTSLALQNLRVAPGTAAGLLAEGAGATLDLRDVEVLDPTCRGVDVSAEAALTADGLVIRGLTPCTTDDDAAALLVEEGGGATVTRAFFTDNEGVAGVLARSSALPTDVSLSDVVVRRTLGNPDFARLGAGVVVQNTGGPPVPVSVQLDRGLVERLPGQGLASVGFGTSLTVTDSLVREIGGQDTSGLGGGFRGTCQLEGGTTSLTRTTITGAPQSASYAVNALLPGTSAELTDVVLAENKSGGVGAYILATVTANRIVSVRNAGDNLAAGLGGTLTVEDAVVGDTASPPILIERGVPTDTGMGLRVINVPIPGLPGGPATLTARRVIIDRAREGGVLCEGIDANCTLEDVVVRNMLQRGDVFGRGLWATNFGHLEARRVLVERSRDTGVAVRNFAELVLEDAVVRQSLGNEPDGIFGRGLSAQNGTVTLARVSLTEHRDLGVALHGATADLSNVRIEAIDTRACEGQAGCVANGHALGIYEGTTLTAQDMVIRAPSICGVHLARGADADLLSGMVTGATIGACVQIDDYDTSRLQNEMVYVENQRNLDATRLPVPEPASSL